MNRALAYGLMGAAQGVLGGMYNEWQQNQQDIHTQKLLQAKAREQAGVERLAHYYRSQENVKKVQMAFANDKSLAKQKAASDLDLAKQKQKAEAALHEKDNATDIKIARIRAAASNKPKPSLYQLPDGSRQYLSPGDPIPPGAIPLPKPRQLVIAQKGNENQQTWSGYGAIPPGYHVVNNPIIDPRIQSILGGYGSGNDNSSTQDHTSASAPNPAPTFHGQPAGQAFHGFGTRGTSRDNPMDADALKGAPQPGTWLKLADGSVKQYMGSK